MKTSVIIPTLDDLLITQRLLKNIALQDKTPDEIIIIEGGSVKWSSRHIPEILKKRTIILYKPNGGISPSKEFGRIKASGEILFFFDNDVIPPKTYIKDALFFFSRNIKTLGIGGYFIEEQTQTKNKLSIAIGKVFKIYSNNERNVILKSGWGDYVRGKNLSIITSAEWLFGCNMALRSKIFLHKNVQIETQMKGWSFLEDLLLGIKITKKFGVCMKILPELNVFHKPVNRSGKLSKETLKMRYLYRYIIWRDYINDHSIQSYLHYCLGFTANFLLALKQIRRFWVIKISLQSLYLTIIHRNINFKHANTFIYSKN